LKHPVSCRQANLVFARVRGEKNFKVSVIQKIFLPPLMAAVFLVSCARDQYKREARSISASMSLEQKVGQVMMIGVPGAAMNTGAETIIGSYLPGGVVLFGHNLASIEAITQYIGDLQHSSLRHSGIPLFISVDQEGGRVERIRSGVTQFPGNMAAGVSGDTGLAYEWGRILGLELRKAGVNMNLAPVLDVNVNPSNPVINTRSFGSDPRLVADMGASYIRGLQDSHCISVGKHFPGHGDTDKDSHYTLPVIRRGMKRLERVELPPFRKAVDAGVECIMTAHVSYPLITGNSDPATFSPFFMTRILRGHLRFKGLVITDDLEMAAVSNREEMGEAAVRSIIAGADIVLVSSYGPAVPSIADAIRRAVVSKRISASRLDDSVRRILEAKLNNGVMRLEKGKIRAGGFAITHEEERLLSEAGRVNSELSRRGLLYFGDIKLLYPGGDAERIFITSSRLLGDILSEDKENIVCGPIDLRRCTARVREKTVLYLHIVHPDRERIRAVSRYCAGKGIGFVLVSSGDPFPITASGLVGAGLLSFSNTDESIRQLGLCLNGRFMPMRDAGLDLGIKYPPRPGVPGRGFRALR
jgi:beta-glucosidase-like glycosyl hydrolase